MDQAIADDATAPVHPGEILAEEFLAPHGLSAGKAARLMKLPRTRIERLVSRVSPVTTDTAIRLGLLFRTTPEFWMNLQVHFDLVTAERPAELKDIEPVNAAA